MCWVPSRNGRLGSRCAPEVAERPEPFGAGAYVAVFVGYVALGLAFKSVFLNWVVGPLFMAGVLVGLPALWRAVRQRS